MQKPGLLNRLRSYIWKEGHEQEPNVRIGLEDSTKNKTMEQNTTMQSASLNRSLYDGTPNVSTYERPNDELRSFFEANGDRELSKIEVLGVLNLISQAVVRDESVLDLSTVSQSTLHSGNSSAFPPNLSNSFSTSNIGDLTSGSRSRRSTRRPLASGPKRHSAKTIVRSQSGIGLRKPAAPVESQSRRRMKPSSSLRDVREYSQPMTGTANDILDLLDSHTDAPVTPGKGLRRRPLNASTPNALSTGALDTPARAAPPKAASTPAINAPTPIPSAQSTIPNSKDKPHSSIFEKPKDTPSLFTQQTKPAAPPQPAPKESTQPTKQQARHESNEPNAPLTSVFTAPTLPEIDVDVEMDFEFPEPQSMPVNAADLQNSEKYAQEFVF